jgi:hypothetical protein
MTNFLAFEKIGRSAPNHEYRKKSHMVALNCSVAQYEFSVNMAIAATAVWWVYWWWCGAAMASVVVWCGSRRWYFVMGAMAAYMNLSVCYDQVSYAYRNEMSGIVKSLHNTLGAWCVMPIIMGLKVMGGNQCNSVKWGITYFYAIMVSAWWAHRAFCRLVYKTPEPPAVAAAPEPPAVVATAPQPPALAAAAPQSRQPPQGAVAFGQSQHRLIHTGQPSPISFQHNGQHIGKTIVATNYYNNPAYESDDADLSDEMYMRS